MEETEKEYKSYYAIIPASVRYDSDLVPNAKLLYGEITALANERGYCFATNRYFAELYNVSISTISRWIGSLCDKGFVISFDHIKKDGSIERRLRIGFDNYINTPNQNNHPPYSKKSSPLDENKKHNNTINNTVKNKNNNNKEIDFSFVDIELKDIWSLWIEYKKERKEMYKFQSTAKTAYETWVKQCKNDKELLEASVKFSIKNQYQGTADPYKYDFDKFCRDNNIKQYRPKEEPKEVEMVYFKWKDDGTAIPIREIEKDKAEAYFANMAQGGLIPKFYNKSQYEKRI